jgi:hypothetical protein
MTTATLERVADPFVRQKMTRDMALQRYPRLISHMICESLGYFSPLAAANALAHHINGTPFACEWYSHVCSCRGQGLFHDDTLVQVGREVVRAAFQQRHRHKGPMAEYQQALALVQAERSHSGVTTGMLASWF